MRCLLAFALAAALPGGAAYSQREHVVPPGEFAPNMRPCIDYAGRGAIASTGTPEHIDIPDDLLGHSLYRYRFTERSELLGHSSWRVTQLAQGGHSLRTIAYSDVALFLISAAKPSYFRWEWVWKDRQGRPFIPIMRWPEPDDRASDWRPMAIRRFAKPVSYRDPQQYWEGLSLVDDGDDDPDLYVTSGGRRHVRYGLYLSDIPAIFAAARDEDCWR